MKEIFYTSLHLKDGLGLEFTACQGELNTFTVCDAFRYFAGHAYLLTSQSWSHTEYLIPTDNITVLD